MKNAKFSPKAAYMQLNKATFGKEVSLVRRALETLGLWLFVPDSIEDSIDELTIEDGDGHLFEPYDKHGNWLGMPPLEIIDLADTYKFVARDGKAIYNSYFGLKTSEELEISIDLHT